MATANSTRSIRAPKGAIHPAHPYASRFEWPNKGKLRWLGGNLAIDFPVVEEVMDDRGNVFFLDLDQVLQHLDDFDGRRGNMSIKENLIANCFTAYEYRLLTPDERETFERYVREKISTLTQFEAARKIMLGGAA